jgi:hypothetical protein
VKNPAPEYHVIGSFTSDQWRGRPPIFTVFFVSLFIGFIASLFLLLVIPALRSLGTMFLFASTCAAIATRLLIAAQLSTEESFLRRFHEHINRTVFELTGDGRQQLSLQDLKSLMAGSQPLPLLVNGIPGLEVRAVPGQRTQKASNDEIASREETVDQRRARLTDGVRPWLIDIGWRASRLFGSAPQLFLRGLKESPSDWTGQAAALTLLVVAVVTPEYGTESFDKLLAAASHKEKQSPPN